MARTRELKEIDLGALSENGSLLKRQLGERICLSLKKELRRLSAGALLCLDLRRIRYATASCLNEILRIFDESKTREHENKFLLLRVNLRNEELIDSLNSILRDRGAVIPAVDEKGNRRLFGELSKALRETLELIWTTDDISSSQVSAAFGIPLSAASNRLKQLYEMKLTRREEETILASGGRQYVYQRLSL